MRLSTDLLLLSLSALAYAASVETLKETDKDAVIEEGDEYAWRKKVGRTLEKLGRWLQGKYSAVSEEEEKEFALLNAELKELAVGVAEELAQETVSFDEYDDEAAAYGWGKWRKKITGAAKKVAKAVILNKVASVVAGGLG
uniref:Putative salivary gland secreted protein n=1 Tax=Ixodes ricinus TaxID=34613 RepID=A0A131Y4R7_IXORI